MKSSFSLLSPLERNVLQLLGEGLVLTTDIVNTLSEREFSVQASYRAIASLKKKEVISIYKKQILINPLWAEDFLGLATRLRNLSYSDFKQVQNYLSGEITKSKISFTFKDWSQGAIFWAQILLRLSHEYYEKENLFAYNKHQIFLLLWKEYEIQWFKQMSEKVPHILFVIGGTDSLDFKTKEFVKNIPVRYSISGDVFAGNYDFTNIIGDYIIRVRLPHHARVHIDEWYQENQDFNEEAHAELREMVDKYITFIKIELERNEEKAEKLKKRIGKHFVLE